MKKLYTFLLLFSSLAFLAFGILRSNGYVGATEKDGGAGCICHSFSPFSQVSGWVEGPDSVLVGTTTNYKLYLTGGPKIRGGFNLAVSRGKVSPVDGLTKLMQYVANDSQLTHTSPLNFSGKDTISWSFSYRAPSTIGFDTIYSVVNSTNGNGSADGNDRWNFGRKFLVKVHNTPVSVDNENLIVSDFKLFQNYPNPFNPNTVISWKSPVGSWQTLKVYDISGNEVATLVDEYREAGKHDVRFDGENLASGIYFYKLSTESFVQVRKLILIK